MMDFEKSSFVKLISENPGDPDPLKRATEFLLKTIIKKRFKGKLQFLQNLKSRNLCQDLDEVEGKKDGSKKVNSQLPPYSSMVMEAVMGLREKGGSSRQTVFTFLTQKYPLGDDQRSTKEKIAAAIRYNVKKGELVQVGAGLKSKFQIPSNTLAGKIWNRSLKNRKRSPNSGKKRHPLTSVKKITFKVCKRASLTATKLNF